MRTKSDEMTNQQTHESDIDRSLYPELYPEDSTDWEDYENRESCFDLGGITAETHRVFTDADIDSFNEVTEDDFKNRLIKEHKFGKRNQSAFSYYMIGKEIDSYFKGNHGESELRYISNLTGIKMRTLRNACRFFRLYSVEHFHLLFTGPFPPWWYQIAHNLSVHPDRLIEIHRKSKHRWDFDFRIFEFKHFNEVD